MPTSANVATVARMGAMPGTRHPPHDDAGDLDRAARSLHQPHPSPPHAKHDLPVNILGAWPATGCASSAISPDSIPIRSSCSSTGLVGSRWPGRRPRSRGTSCRSAGAGTETRTRKRSPRRTLSPQQCRSRIMVTLAHLRAYGLERCMWGTDWTRVDQTSVSYND